MLCGRRLYYTANFVASLAIFFFGYDQGIMGGVNNSPDYVRVMRLGYSTYGGSSEGYVVTITEPTRQGGIVSIYYLGTLLGCLMGGALGDRIGRIKTMILGSVWVLAGAILQCSAQNITWMLCARLINGIGTGYLNAIVPVWSAEVASPKTRGAFIASEFTLNIFGVVVSYWLEFGLSFIGDGTSQVRWRLPIAIQVLPILVFMAKSPRWLMKVGRLEEARLILARFRSEDGDPEKPGVMAEYDEILATVQLEKEHAAGNSYIAMFFGLHDGDLHVARRVQLSMWLQIFQEWTGIAAIIFYASTIFSNAGYAPRKSQWLSGLNYITYTLCSLFGVAAIDRVGRRIGLWWGAVGQGTSLILAGAFSRLLKNNHAKSSQYGGAAALFVFSYTAIFGATWLAIPWVYQTETFPLYVRARGNAWGMVGWSIGNGWMTLLNPIMFSRMRENTLHVFGAINFVTIPIVWAFYPETANRTLEEMDHLFTSRSPFVWDEEAHFRLWKEGNGMVTTVAKGTINEDNNEVVSLAKKLTAE
ncbi:general substrate transporter [Laetiporus sulphureus 93-53]|uniref:General substrate transporter n=1 Tax=Laetiporus sulphureus 93-53 TaxID=1314785 RepID=A0A165BAG8_9APHY|nr:general substrate transporter [Laetiporus sulphureus 93-53]KZT00617.1 general substrate transporter [Laetiporus sulphureus 93-53]